MGYRFKPTLNKFREAIFYNKLETRKKKNKMRRERKLVQFLAKNLLQKSLYNYKEMPIDIIAKEMLEVIPFYDYRNFRILFQLVSKKMDEVHPLRWRKENSKKHRGNLNKALNKQFCKQKKDRLKRKTHQLEELKIKIIVNEFEMELVNSLFDNKTPRTKAIAEEEKVIFNRYGKQDADFLRVHFQKIANELKSKCMDTNKHVRRYVLQQKLTAKIQEIRKFAYPLKQDKIPNLSYQD